MSDPGRRGHSPVGRRDIWHAPRGPLGLDVAYDELSVAVGASYSFAPRWTVGVDLDFGIVDDLLGSWERNPEFGIGVGVSCAFPIGGRWNLVVGPELSWKFSDEEFQLGLNTGVSFDF